MKLLLDWIGDHEEVTLMLAIFVVLPICGGTLYLIYAITALLTGVKP